MANTIGFMDGFENFAATSAQSLVISSASFVTSLATGLGGGLGIKMGSASANNPVWSFNTGLPAPTLNTTWCIVSFMIRRDIGVNYGGTTFHQVSFSAVTSDSSNTNCRMALIVNVNGSISVRKDGTTYGTSAMDVLNPYVWYHIEYRHRYGNASFGNFEVRVNGVSVLTGVGDNSGAPAPRYLYLTGGGLSGNVASNAIWYDDVIYAQSDDASPGWLGLSKVQHLPPLSTSTGEWAGSDGNSTDNHLLVDDIDATSSDWVTSTAGTAKRDLYTHAPATPGATVHAVQVRTAAALDTLGTDDFSFLVKSGASESAVRKTLGQGAPIWIQSPPYNTDPATGTAWTKEAFDASLFGVKS